MNHSRKPSMILIAALGLGGCHVSDQGYDDDGPYMPDPIPERLDEVTAAVCETIDECCESTPFDSSSSTECAYQVSPHLEHSLHLAAAISLGFGTDWQHDDCHDPSACSVVPTAGSLYSCEGYCAIFFGAQLEGEACLAVGHRMSDCQQGLACGADRICHEPCEVPLVAPENGFCGPTRGMWFVACDAGLACADDHGTCQPAQPLGAACDATIRCAVGGWCDTSTSTCAGDRLGGNPCTEHDQCVSDVCKDGVCYEPASAICGRWGW